MAGKRMKPSRIVYVNAYETDRLFGGPEEGGWYYEVGYPIESAMLINPTDTEIQKKIAQVKSKYQNDIGDNNLRVCNQSYPAAFYPENRPYYE